MNIGWHPAPNGAPQLWYWDGNRLIDPIAQGGNSDHRVDRVAPGRHVPTGIRDWNGIQRKGFGIMTVRPTVLDVARAVAKLNELHDNDARALVTSNLAFQFARHNGWGGRRIVTTRDVRAALIAHGASQFTVEQHARAIAAAIRADFSDGRQS